MPAALTILVPATAGATTTIGDLAPIGSAAGCAECTYLQHTTDPTAPSYVVPPGAWTVTAWSARGGASEGTARLRVFRPTDVPDRYLLVDQSAAATLPADEAPSSSTQIGVLGGDVLGLRTGSENRVPGAYLGQSGDESWLLSGDPGLAFAVGDGTPFPGTPSPASRVNVAATLEQDTTPPDTTITRRPPSPTHKHLQRYRFTSSEPGALFDCKLDHGPYRPCIPPHKVQPRIGSHRFRVRATDVAGNVDPTPASDRFRIVNG